MALDIADVQDLIRILRENPALRDAARAELVDEDIRALPLIVRRLAEGQDRMEAAIRDLVAAHQRADARTDRLEAALRDLAAAQARTEARLEELVGAQARTEAIVANMNGRLGNVEGWRYEEQFHAAGRVTALLRKPFRVQLGDVDALHDARDDRVLSASDWDQLNALDFLFQGRDGRGPDAPVAFVALEVSRTVDRNDVRRAHERAVLLRKAGLRVFAAAGGQQITEGARELAEEYGVAILVDRSEAA